MKRLVTGGLLLLTGCIGRVSARAPSVVTIHYPIQQQVTTSGTRVVAETAPDYGLAAVVVSVAVGSAQDPPNKAGLAHLVEHLLLRQRINQQSLMNRLDALGGLSTNGSTGWDTTRYYTVVPAANAPATIAQLTSILLQPLATITQADFAHELQVVREEMYLRSENGVSGQALNWLFPQVFPKDHPYSNPLGGSRASLGRLTLDDAKQFATKYYTANRATVVVSAPSDTATQLAWVRSALQNTQRTSPLAPIHASDNVIAAEASNPIGRHEAPVPNCSLWIAWRVPSNWGGNSEVGPLLRTIVEAASEYGIETRRIDANVNRLEPGYYAGAAGAVLFVRVAVNREDEAETTFSRVIGQLKSTMTTLVYNTNAFEHMKHFAALDDTFGEENLLKRALNLDESINMSSDPLLTRRRATRTQSLTADVVADAIQKYLAPEHAHAVLIKPYSDSARVSAAPAPSDPAPPEPIDLFRPRPIRPESLRTLDAARLQTRVLDNGLTVWVLPQAGSQYHTAFLGFHGGYDIEPKAGVGTAMLWSRRYVSAPAEFLGLLSRVNLLETGTTFLVRSVGGKPKLSLEKLRRDADFTVDWPPLRFTHQLELFRKEQAEPAAQAHREMLKALFGDHVYGRLATVDEIRSVTASDIYRRLDIVRRPRNAVLIVVGDVDPTEVFDLAEEGFGDFGPRDVTLGEAPTAPRWSRVSVSRDKKLLFANKPGLTQAHLSMLCGWSPLKGEQLAAVHVYGSILADALFHRLREKALASYSVSPNLESFRGDVTTLGFVADLDRAHLPEAMLALRETLDPSADSLVNDESIARARLQTATSGMWANSSTPAVAYRLFLAWNFGLRPNDELNVGPRSVNVTAEQLQQLETTCRESVVLAFVGDESELRDAWQSTGPTSHALF